MNERRRLSWKAIHVVLDNLNTHKKNEPWLKRHPNVTFHFTPTRASWLTIEIGSRSFKEEPHRRFFTAVKQLPKPHRCLHQGLQRERPHPSLDQTKVHQRRVKGDVFSQL